MTRKEAVLLEWARGAFERLGPRALKLMESIVLHEQQTRASKAAATTKTTTASTTTVTSATSSATAATATSAVDAKSKNSKEPDGGVVVPAQTLRGIDRFFRRIEANDGEAAFWSLRKIDTRDVSEPRRTVVPPEVCAGDSLFRNDYHVYPTHVFASLKRAVTCWQKRYVDCFGRRVPAAGWPFPSTLCQVVSFCWMLSEWILERLRLLSRVPDIRASFSSLSSSLTTSSSSPLVVSKKRKAPATKSKEAKEASKQKTREIYLYDYPSYISAPPVEGACPEAPNEPLPALSATSDVVEQFYAQMVDRLLFQDIDASTQTTPVVETEELDLPLLRPLTTRSAAGVGGVGGGGADDCWSDTMLGGLMMLDDAAVGGLPMLSSAPAKKKKPKRISGIENSLTARPDAKGVYAEPVGEFQVNDDGLPLFLLSHEAAARALLSQPRQQQQQYQQQQRHQEQQQQQQQQHQEQQQQQQQQQQIALDDLPDLEPDPSAIIFD
jgi:hypothetical protein